MWSLRDLWNRRNRREAEEQIQEFEWQRLPTLPVKTKAEIEALARERLQGDEIILGVRQDTDGCVHVSLISKRVEQDTAALVRRFGIGGYGRVLTFVKKEGKWVYLGPGLWES